MEPGSLVLVDDGVYTLRIEKRLWNSIFYQGRTTQVGFQIKLTSWAAENGVDLGRAKLVQFV